MKSVLICAAVSAALFIAMATYCSPLVPSVPALQFTYGEIAFRKIIDSWGEAGVERFKRHFLIDFPFLVSYGVLGYLISTRTRLFAHWPAATRRCLTWCLPLAAAADTVENLLHWHLVSGNGPFPSSLYLLAGAIATAKWALNLLFVVVAAWAGLAHLRRR